MTPTPRTDAIADRWPRPGQPPGTEWPEIVPANTARDLERELTQWQTEISKVMPPDFKDWWDNSKSEWPLVARLVIEGKNRNAELDATAYKELERELGELTEHVGRCHDALGEDRASDTSELWKFFETHKRVIARLRIGEDSLAAERAMADRLGNALVEIAGAFKENGWTLRTAITEALSAWKGARRGTD